MKLLKEGLAILSNDGKVIVQGSIILWVNILQKETLLLETKTLKVV